jgi:hypothetical protein
MGRLFMESQSSRPRIAFARAAALDATATLNRGLSALAQYALLSAERSKSLGNFYYWHERLQLRPSLSACMRRFSPMPCQHVRNIQFR